MMDNMNSENKLRMLNEYEKQITNLFNHFQKNQISMNKLIRYFNKLNAAWKTSRIDIKNYGNPENSVKFIEYEKNVKLSYPKWFSDKKGKGCKLESAKTNLNFIFKCISKGETRIFLRGVDFRDINNEKVRIPTYIDINKFVINDDPIIDDNLIVWHDKSFSFKKNCEDNEILFIKLEVKTLFDYFPQLNNKLTNDFTDIEITEFFNKLKRHIFLEKQLINEI